MRLTIKLSNGYYEYNNYEELQHGGHIDKLGQLEDIEEEAGTDLLTLFQALLLKGIYVKWNDKYIVHIDANLLWLRTDVKPYAIDFKQSDKPYYLKDYGISWALTKEELWKKKN